MLLKTGKFLRNNFRRIIVVFFVSLLILSAILYRNPMGRYVVVQGYHQSKILFRRKSIKKILEDPKTAPEIRRKLELVKEIKAFGVKLGLREGNTYTTVYDTSGQPAVYAVSACHKDRLQAVEWNFPIVGRMPYLGYFKKEDALAKADELKKQGFDVLVRPVSAYSTLGFFPDPLFSSMLSGGECYLSDTILHEMTHETVFIKNDVSFNESLAMFVGDQGAVEFLGEKYGKDSRELQDLFDSRRDDRIFSDFMADFYIKMEEFYSRPVSAREKIIGREEMFKDAKREYRERIRPALKSDYYDYFLKLELNNAYILFNRKYHRDVNMFEELFVLQGSDLVKTVDYVKSLKNDPEIQQKIRSEIDILKNDK